MSSVYLRKACRAMVSHLIENDNRKCLAEVLQHFNVLVYIGRVSEEIIIAKQKRGFITKPVFAFV